MIVCMYGRIDAWMSARYGFMYDLYVVDVSVVRL